MLAIVIEFADAGSLRFAPWLLLLVPFVFVRISLRKIAGDQTISAAVSLRVANVVVEAAMVAIFVYMYNLSVLSYCPPPK